MSQDVTHYGLVNDPTELANVILQYLDESLMVSKREDDLRKQLAHSLGMAHQAQFVTTPATKARLVYPLVLSEQELRAVERTYHQTMVVGSRSWKSFDSHLPTGVMLAVAVGQLLQVFEGIVLQFDNVSRCGYLLGMMADPVNGIYCSRDGLNWARYRPHLLASWGESVVEISELTARYEAQELTYQSEVKRAESERKQKDRRRRLIVLVGCFMTIVFVVLVLVAILL